MENKECTFGICSSDKNLDCKKCGEASRKRGYSNCIYATKSLRKLMQISGELKDQVMRIYDDNHISDLGFVCKGKLLNYEGYENFHERLWVWMKTEAGATEDEVYIAITFDTGNCSCILAYTDMYIKELVMGTQPI